MFEHILVAVDHNEDAHRILAAAKEIAGLSGGTVNVFHVRELSGSGPDRGGPTSSEELDEAHKFVKEIVADLTAAGLKASGSVRNDVGSHVALTIQDEATAIGASSIIIGSTGLTDIGDLVHHGTVHRLLHLTRLPVVVVR